MFFPESQVRIWLYTGPTDMRKSFDGLAALVKHQLQEDPLSGQLFVFIDRRRSYMKVSYFDRSVYCLWCKRLEEGRFQFSGTSAEKHRLDWMQLKLILEGITLKNTRRYRRYHYPLPG